MLNKSNAANTEPEKPRYLPFIPAMLRGKLGKGGYIEFTVLCMLISRMNPGKGKLTCYPSLDKLVEDTGASKTAVFAAIKSLIEKGAIVRDKRPSKCKADKHSRSNMYHLNVNFFDVNDKPRKSITGHGNNTQVFKKPKVVPFASNIEPIQYKLDNGIHLEEYENAYVKKYHLTPNPQNRDYSKRKLS